MSLVCALCVASLLFISSNLCCKVPSGTLIVMWPSCVTAPPGYAADGATALSNLRPDWEVVTPEPRHPNESSATISKTPRGLKLITDTLSASSIKPFPFPFGLPRSILMRSQIIQTMLLLYRGESFDPDFFYHAGMDIDHAFLLVSGRKKTVLVPKMNEGIARARFRGKVVAYDDPLKALSKLIKGKSVLCDASSLSLRMGKRLGKICRLKDHSVELLQE